MELTLHGAGSLTVEHADELGRDGRREEDVCYSVGPEAHGEISMDTNRLR